MSVTFFNKQTLKQGLKKGSNFAGVPPLGDSPTTTDLKLWLKPEELTFSAGRVAGWDDSSPSPISITLPGGSNNPYESSQTLNGFTGSRFDGNTSVTYLSYGTDIWDTGTGANESTVIALFYPETATGGNYGAIIAQGGSGRTSVACCPQAYPDASIKWATNNYASGGRKINGTSSAGNWYKVTWTWSNWQTRSTTEIRLGNVVEASADWDSAPNSVASGNRYIGRFLDAGADAIVDGTLMELLVYRRVLSETELTTINNYLNTKYAL